ncbi:MAG TPA: dihydroorotate dehydrogenase-like protein [Acidimicrobiales bacterium]|nr:dihydroorotate dehydrogenase-like protein [Acidimicrobiales bacterium]
MSVDLTTEYLGLKLANPLVASASPMTGSLGSLRRLQEAGIGAVVLPSLFEEQVEHDQFQIHQVLEYGTGSFAEAAAGYLPEAGEYNLGTDGYLAEVEDAAKELDIPVIASLNGTSTGGWTRYATRLESAGADALELNTYLIVTDPTQDCAAVEERYLELVSAVVAAVRIPVSVKISPFFSSLPHMAHRFEEAGASGLVLFNRFYQPDIDLDELTMVPNLVLSTPDELRLPLRWIGILRGEFGGSLAATSGVHSASDVIKAILVGADVAMMASALLEDGPALIPRILSRMTQWLDERDYVSTDQMRGSMALTKAADPEHFVRANYVRMLSTFSVPLR